MMSELEPSWHVAMISEFEKPYWEKLSEFVTAEYRDHTCFPEQKDIFRATHLTPLSEVKVVVLGQDPYHTPGAAMGLSFSIPNGIKVQPSLKNIFKELETDLGIRRTNTDLSDIARQGVLLLNSVLTVRSGLPASHKKQGWENFTDAMISTVSRERT